MNASVTCLMLAWLVGCVGIYKSDVTRDWYLIIAVWLALGSVLALLMFWFQPSLPSQSPTFHDPGAHPTLPKETSTSTRPQWEVIDDTLRDILLSPLSQQSPQGRFAFAQRHAHSLRRELKAARSEDQPRIIDRLIQTLTQQLQLLGDVHQRPSNKYGEQFNAIIREIEELRDLSKTLK